MHMHHTDLQSEHQAVIEEIHAAFADVSREGGVSWSEAEVRDRCGTDEERAAARAKDIDRHWSDLIDNSEWQDTGIGGFSFLDPIAIRYYLPAAMIRTMNDDWNGDLTFRLTIPANPSNPRHHLRRGNFALGSLSLLDDRQCRCIARFIKYMIARDETASDFESEWRNVYESYWHLI